MKTKSLINNFYLAVFSLLIFYACSTNPNKLTLVKNGIPNAVIVVPDEITELQQIAVDDFVKTVKKASGAKIPVITEHEVSSVSGYTVKIILGPGSLSESILGENPELKPEEYKIISNGNYLIILANDVRDQEFKYCSRVTTWAFDYILHNYLNVKWLWPGDLGTVVPEKKTIIIPEINVAWQPPLAKRRFRIGSNPELIQWGSHHQVLGQRKSYNIGHSFTPGADNGDWWKKFSQTHLEYFAKDPDGKVTLLYPVEKARYKLDISNPDVAREVVKTWKEAGKPDFWNVAPNDGRGFCTCDNCLELDRKYGLVFSKKNIWNLDTPVVLTDRYVWFWNHIVHEMRKENPNVEIGTYFYSVYRNPPQKLKLKPGIIGGLVSGFDFLRWKTWEDAGASGIGLRPNWWHMGGNGPYLPLRLAGGYLEKAREHKMVYIDMDSMMEYWATQGPYYYLIARLIARPDLDVEDVVTEYCDAFGEASPEIRRYLDYWEEYHKRVAYNIPAGGGISQDSTGIYETVCREHFGKVQLPLDGHWKTLPYIYTPDVLDKGYQILDMATSKANDSEVIKRIDLLRDGLKQLEKTLKVIAVDAINRVEALKDLEAFSKQMKEKYGYWGSNGISVMKRRGVIGEIEINFEGM